MDADLGGRKIIVDSSFIRSCPGDGSALRRLVERGARLVLIDNLVYELCSTDNQAQWPASQRKLRPCADALEWWEHTGVMLKAEAEGGQPYGNPLREEPTQVMRDLLQSGTTCIPDDLVVLTQEAREQRESASVPVLFRACEAYAPCVPELAATLRNQGIADAITVCTEFVNDLETIRRCMRDGTSPCPFPAERVDQTWLAWHHYKGMLAFLCEYLRQGSPRFEDLAANVQHRWINRKHDLDYLISLSRADGLATNETAGEMYHFCRWMYAETKVFIPLRDA
jgi:hypothetical protein